MDIHTTRISTYPHIHRIHGIPGIHDLDHFGMPKHHPWVATHACISTYGTYSDTLWEGIWPPVDTYGYMGHHMCSHTPLECPLGISMGTSIEMYTLGHHLEGLQIGLRYLQIPEIWLFWTYPWNPRYHGNRPIWPFWTSEIPPVSSYSRLYIQIWAYSDTLWEGIWPPLDTLWVHGTPYVLPYTPRMPFGHIHGISHDIHTCLLYTSPSPRD